MKDLEECGIHVFELDVTKEESVQAVFQQVAKLSNGKLDYLFNNAGTSCTFPAMDLNIEDAQDCFAVNFFGVVRMTKVFLPLLMEAEGTIVQTGSVAGKIAFPFGSVYSASKAALHQYSDVLRIELKPFNVKVVTLMVGGVRTDIADTRPLPKDSLYLMIDDGIQARRSMARDNKPMPAAEFAEHVVSQVCVRKTATRVLWDGQMATVFWLITLLVPQFVMDYILSRKFMLTKLATIMSKQKKE